MRNSRSVIRGILVIAVITAVLFLLDFLLYPRTFVRNDVHAITTQTYDDLYLGTSHGKIGISPASAEEVSGRTGFNACVGGEYTVDAYYLLQMAIASGHAPKRVVYEVSPGYFISEKEEGNNYLLFYHEFPWSVTKGRYFADSIMKCNFRTMLFPWYEYPLSTELKRLPETVKVKWNHDYDVEALKSSTQEYHEDGFVERYPVDPETFSWAGVNEFHAEDVSDYNMEYMTKMIELCRREGIELVAVLTPLPKETLQKYPDGYEEADAFFGDYFRENEVRFINFNSREYYGEFTHKTEYYTDYDGHMSGDTARNFSKKLAVILGD